MDKLQKRLTIQELPKPKNTYYWKYDRMSSNIKVRQKKIVFVSFPRQIGL